MLDKILSCFFDNSTVEAKKILIVSAHPDDMELSCSAFAFFLVMQGFQIKSVVVTSERRDSFFPDGQAVGVIREQESIAASQILEISPPLFLRNYIWELDYNVLLVQLRMLIKSEPLDIVLTHFPVDGHLDHAIIGTVLYEIFQNPKSNVESNVCALESSMLPLVSALMSTTHKALSYSKDFKLVFFRSPGSYSFVPSVEFNLTEELIKKKWLALQAHKSQKFYEVPIESIRKTEEFILARRYMSITPTEYQSGLA